MTTHTCFDVEIRDKIAHIRLKRPQAFNTMNRAFWNELPVIVRDISDNALARAIVFHTHWFVYWSGGCFVTPGEINERLIDTTHGGTFVYVHRSRD